MDSRSTTSGAHSLRGCEDRGGEPTGTSADDHNVEVTVVSRQGGVHPPRLGNVLVGGVMQDLATNGRHPDQNVGVRRVVADLA